MVFIAGSYLKGAYNNFIVMSEEIDGKWAQVDNQLQRRFDLISNLVSSVSGAMQQEREVFGKIAEARKQYAGAQTTEEKMEANQKMNSALSRLLLIMENYPQLKSIDTVQSLMVQIEGTENRLAVARKDFNEEVKKYNKTVKQFPTMILANIFGFDEKEYFQIEEGAGERPEVNFNFN
jgi:LemA protein